MWTKILLILLTFDLEVQIMQKKEMYNPCITCMDRFGRQYTEDCDNNCDYAHVLGMLRPYGKIEEIVDVMQGKRVPIAMLNKENIDGVLAVIYAAKNGIDI